MAFRIPAAYRLNARLLFICREVHRAGLLPLIDHKHGKTLTLNSCKAENDHRVQRLLLCQLQNVGHLHTRCHLVEMFVIDTLLSMRDQEVLWQGRTSTAIHGQGLGHHR